MRKSVEFAPRILKTIGVEKKHLSRIFEISNLKIY